MSATQITSVKPKQGTQPSFKSSPAPPPAASEHTGPEFLLTCWLSLCPQVAKATCIVATRVPQSTQHDEPSYAFAKMRWEDSCCRGQKTTPEWCWPWHSSSDMGATVNKPKFEERDWMKLEAGTLKKLENKCFTRCSKSARVFASKRNTLDHFVANKDAEKWVTQTLHTHKYLAYNLAASKQLVYGVLPILPCIGERRQTSLLFWSVYVPVLFSGSRKALTSLCCSSLQSWEPKNAEFKNTPLLFGRHFASRAQGWTRPWWSKPVLVWWLFSRKACLWVCRLTLLPIEVGGDFFGVKKNPSHPIGFMGWMVGNYWSN